MNFKFIDKDGQEINISNLGAFIELVKSGQIDGDTLLYDDKESKWKKAAEYEEFQAVLTNLAQSKKEEISVLPIAGGSTKNRSKKLFLISMVLILAAIVFLSVASAKYYIDATKWIAYILKQSLAYSLRAAIVSYLIWRFIFKKREGIGLLCFAILFLSISSYQAITMIKGVRQVNIVVKDRISAIEDLEKKYFSGQNIELEPMMVWFNNQLSIIKQDYADFSNAMKKEHIETFFTPDTLSNHSKIVDAKYPGS